MIRIITRDDVNRALPMSGSWKTVSTNCQAGRSAPPRPLSTADVICTATTSLTPVIDGASVTRGTSINAVGTCMLYTQEMPPQTVLRAHVVVDHRESALAEVGDLIVPEARRFTGEGYIDAELGEVVSGT